MNTLPELETDMESVISIFEDASSNLPFVFDTTHKPPSISSL
jgi:hypothetical protein